MYTYYGTFIRRLPAERGGADKILTRKIDYFRASAPSHANERKTETPGLQTLPREIPSQGSQKAPISPLYGTNRGLFSSGKCQCIVNCMGWIGRSMGWKQQSKGWIDENVPSLGISIAKRRTETPARINSLPYSAQSRATAHHGIRPQGMSAAQKSPHVPPAGGVRRVKITTRPARRGCPPRRDAIHRVSHRPHGPREGKMSRRG